MSKVDAHPERIAAGNRVFANGTTLVWGTWNNVEKRTALYAAGRPPKHLGTYPGGINLLMADDSAAYFVSDRVVMRQPLAGGSPSRIHWAASAIHALTVSKDTVYWSEHDYEKKRGRIMAGSKRGGAARIIAPVGDVDLGTELLVDADGSVYWVESKKLMVLRSNEKIAVVDAEDVRTFAVDASHVYLGGAHRGDLATLRRHIKPNGPTEILVPRYWHGEHGMRIIGDYVYATEDAWHMKHAHPAHLVRARKSGGCTQLVADLGDYFNEVYADEGHIYWADSEKEDIFSTSIRELVQPIN